MGESFLCSGELEVHFRVFLGDIGHEDLHLSILSVGMSTKRAYCCTDGVALGLQALHRRISKCLNVVKPGQVESETLKDPGMKSLHFGCLAFWGKTLPKAMREVTHAADHPPIVWGRVPENRGVSFGDDFVDRCLPVLGCLQSQVRAITVLDRESPNSSL